MTNRKQALQDLLAKVEAGDYVSTFEYKDALGSWKEAHNANHGSLDAAKKLHEAFLPGWHFDIATEANENGFYANFSSPDWDSAFTSWADNPARAWLIAILKALISEASE